MKRLTCKMCGSTDIIKEDGVFVCQSCGCKYSVEEAKKLMIEGTVEVKVDSSNEVNNLLKRAFMFLEAGNLRSAEEYCEKVLDIDSENAQAYLGKLMSDLQVKTFEQLKTCRMLFDNNANYLKAIKYADKALKETLIDYAENIKPIPDGATYIDEDTIAVNRYSLKNIIIPDTVKRIGGSAFSGCTCLTSVTIPNSVTKIGMLAFKGCTSLTSVTIPDSVTEIDSWTFEGCTSLTSVTIPDSVTKIDRSAFEGCTILTSVTIPDSVTTIGHYAFKGCTNLTSVTIPDSVTTIGKCAFEGCTSLTSITIPDSVTEIDSSAFSGCTSLTSVTIPNSLTRIGSWTFEGCTSLTSVTILNSVTIPNSVTISGCFAFKDCKSLTDIKIPSCVNLSRDVFLGCPVFDNRKSMGVCLYCGGDFKGLFTKKCEKCGRKKCY